MPTARPERCPAPGCHALTTEHGRCPDHQRKPWENPSANTRTLTRADRRRFHDAVLTRDPRCVCTGQCGTTHHSPCGAPSTEADHIVPIAHGGAHTDPTNGRGLCHHCHQGITRRTPRR